MHIFITGINNFANGFSFPLPDVSVLWILQSSRSTDEKTEVQASASNCQKSYLGSLLDLGLEARLISSSTLYPLWRASLVAQLVKSPLAMQKAPVQSLRQEDP